MSTLWKTDTQLWQNTLNGTSLTEITAQLKGKAGCFLNDCVEWGEVNHQNPIGLLLLHINNKDSVIYHFHFSGHVIRLEQPHCLHEMCL